MKVSTYLLPLIDSFCIGPHTSQCISSSLPFALDSDSLGKESRLCLLKIQLSHLFASVLKLGKPTTILFDYILFKLE
uniref:Uncharacterized protein n=1 Tax=Brassica oleracea var. oleracea TaxID=109376 RepID=A0A0D3D761_BRAOL